MKLKTRKANKTIPDISLEDYAKFLKMNMSMHLTKSQKEELRQTKECNKQERAWKEKLIIMKIEALVKKMKKDAES